MKRLISIAMISMMILSALVFTACGDSSSGGKDVSDSKYVGKWKATTVALGEESGELEDEFILTLNDDGTGSLSGGENDTEFTWELTSNGFKTTGDAKLKFTDDGDNIKTKFLGVALIFERQ